MKALIESFNQNMANAPVGQVDSVLSDDNSHITFSANKYFMLYRTNYIKLASLIQNKHPDMERVDDLGFKFSKRTNGILMHIEVDFYTDDGSSFFNAYCTIPSNSKKEMIDSISSFLKEEFEFFTNSVHQSQLE